jgi:hypothetical protein
VGFEHIGPFAGPRIAIPQVLADSVGREVWQLSCEAVGLPVDQPTEAREEEEEAKHQGDKKGGKQHTKKNR